MKKQLLLSSALLAALFVSGCQQETPQASKPAQPAASQAQPASPHMGGGQMGQMNPQQQARANTLTGTVLETIDASGYVYVHMDTPSGKVWAAGPPTAIKQGDTLTIATTMPMQNFHSKALNRDFPVLYFVDRF